MSVLEMMEFVRSQVEQRELRVKITEYEKSQDESIALLEVKP